MTTTYTHLWDRLSSWQNLQAAYENPGKHKTNNPACRLFAEHLAYELALLRYELRTKTYRPRPLRQFILRDPKTRVICKSDFRDRVIHQALVNILPPIFEPTARACRSVTGPARFSRTSTSTRSARALDQPGPF